MDILRERGGRMCNDEWILCPVCGNKTRIKIRDDTVIENFPLFCPKCRQETIINVIRRIVSVIKEPDAKTQSR
ncbi:MAG: conjugal transfer protein [Firmicutes bacterium]|nr:conjugal transfer protein [Bacillota bacterium]